MKIFDRNPNPDSYEVKNIEVQTENGSVTETHANVFLLVSLEPVIYVSARGNSTKENSCRLRIELGELRELERALQDKLWDYCQMELQQKRKADTLPPSQS